MNTMTMTTEGVGKVEIVLFGKGTATIDWGDGVAEEVGLKTAGDTFNDDKEPRKVCAHTYADKSAHTITVKGENVTHLMCNENQLTQLDVCNNPKLERLDCRKNRLASLDVTKNVALTGLLCSGNEISELDVSQNTALIELYCSNNKLSGLDVSKNPELRWVRCDNNQQKIDASPNNTVNVPYANLTTVWNEIASRFMESAGDTNLIGVWDALSAINLPMTKKVGEMPKALDFGCGAGILAERLSIAGFDVYACDKSAEMICGARKKFPNSNVRYDIGGIDLLSQLPPCRLITATMVFHTTNDDDLERIICGLRDKLDDGGLLFFTVHQTGYALECNRAGEKLSGLFDVSFPATGEIKIGKQFIPCYVRNPECYTKIFAKAGMTRVGHHLENHKFYMAWFKKKIDFNVILFDDFETLDAFGPVEVIGSGNLPYRIKYFSLKGGIIESSQQLRVETLPFNEMNTSGVLLIPGGKGREKLVEDENFFEQLKILSEKACFVLTVCTGSALLAKTNLLNGVKATTYKMAFKEISKDYPEVKWEKPARWVPEGKYYTSSGVAAGIDMTLGFICDIHGKEIAKSIAKEMEYTWNSDKDDDPFANCL